MSKKLDFSIEEVIHELKHFLPSQAPLKDFIHHNTLHAFQQDKFHAGLARASEIFGWKTYLQLSEYRERYKENKISEKALDRVLENRSKDKSEWKQKLLFQEFNEHSEVKIGKLRGLWRSEFKIDLDSMIHPTLFRIISSYLDQGISIWNFPVDENGFLASLRKLESSSKVSFFRGELAKKLLLDESIDIPYLLKEVVGDERFYETYLFD
ncbi:MAG: putative inorganic carbon transporter subunit DabA, partial [Bacteroidota bacterium]